MATVLTQVRLGPPTAKCFHLLLLLVSGVVAQAATDAAKQTYEVEAELLHHHWERLSKEQCFPFSLDQSVAREDFAYPDAVTGERKEAKKGSTEY